MYRRRRYKPQLIIAVLAFLLLVYLAIFISSCAHKKPKNINNVCEIFSQKWGWHRHTKNSAKKWGTPIHVQMAILKQESGFKYDAKPPRRKLLGIIPWKRQSTAYGYAQVLNGTWKQYVKDTKNKGADRDSYKDAIDFVGWYTNKTHKMLKISKWDAYNQYLAYHEGQGGYKKKSFNKKPWLLTVAKKVEKNSKIYAKQLKNCD